MRAPCAYAAVLAALGCSDAAVTLPESWNTLHHRTIIVDIFTREPGPAGLVRALQGIDGAPLARAEGLPDLRVNYWDRPNGSEEPDGAHIDVVRIGPESCALALDGMYRGGEHIPASYDFTELERHAASVEGIRGDGILLALDVSAEGMCPPANGGATGDPFADALARKETWAEAAAHTVRFFVGDTLWASGAHAYPIVGVQLFHIPPRVAGGADEDDAFALFAGAARRVRELTPEVAIVSADLALATVEDATSGAIARFLDAVVADDVPLDVIAVKVAGDPQAIAERVAALAEALDARALAVDVAVTELVLPALELPFTADSSLGLAHLGASEMAARIRLQPLPVRWLLSGRGPWLPAGDAFAETPYFDLAGEATPAFTLRLPMRQLAGEQRVSATTDVDDALSVLAAIEPGRVSILISHPATDTGIASLEYTLTVPELTLPTFPSVPYRIAELDQSNRGVVSFFFSDLGLLDVDPKSGDVRLTRTLPVPGVHFIEIDLPSP